jgi:hypothetical protein
METTTYIVRMYRRDRQGPMRGTVECVPGGQVSAFRNARELNALLRPPTAAARESASPRNRIPETNEEEK